MGERIKIGIYYTGSKEWIGGLLYMQNLIKALNSIEDTEKPYIDLYCYNKNDFDELKSNTMYPYLNCNIIRKSIWKVLANRFLRSINYSIMAFDYLKLNSDNVLIYPYGIGSVSKKSVYWIPDFQDKYLPENFTKQELVIREKSIKEIIKKRIPIVFSSADSENDFHKFYMGNDVKTFVVHFAVNHSDYSSVNILDVKKKYGIEGDYVLCANQFWKHKNHLFLFKTYCKALKEGFNYKLVCTGKIDDRRNPDYTNQVRSFIEDNNLDDHIILTGLIDQKELHCLMKNSYAVIQPSLFEGWNTTVEDCKLMGKFIFLSDLRVHHEQAKTNMCFFDPYDEEDLAMKLLSVKPKEEPYEYSNNVHEFAESFLQVIRYMNEKQK